MSTAAGGGEANTAAGGGDQLVLTIDLGTSGPKVALFTVEGRFVDGEFSPVDLVLFPNGGVEQRPSEWWSGVVSGCARLWERVPADDVAGIVAVSVTSQWSGTVPVDAAGDSLHDAVIWMDARGAEVTRRVVGGPVRVAGYDPRKLRRWISLTGGAPSQSGKDPISHILWIADALPDVARATALYLEPKDYLNLRLTGRAVATFDSITLHWLTDNRDPSRIDYVPELLELAGVDRSQLPDLIAATDVVGPLLVEVAVELGLPAGIPVVGGTPDVQSATIGSGAVRDFEGHLYVGTSSWLTCHVPKKKTDILRGVAALPSPLPGKYFVADEQETAGACLNWLRDRVLWPDDSLGSGPAPTDAFARMDALAAQSPPGANGVMFTPWLNGERTPVDDNTIRGGWHHLSLDTDRADLVRAVFEGVALNGRWLLGAVEKFVGRPFPWLHFVGGGASSALWCQIHADVLDREIRQVADPIRANARGAALLAAVALGHVGVDDLAAKVEVAATYQPRPTNRAVYDMMFEAFTATYQKSKGIHRRLASRGRLISGG
ncbi:MAG TPA: FGGY-family carbohydrate kinase [Microthrixaceae bacterium]|nr:FGGY-family carbohydrate kinase [Microthrixaceae bacterium]